MLCASKQCCQGGARWRKGYRIGCCRSNRMIVQHTAFVPFWFVYGISIMDMCSAHTRTVYHARRDSHVFTLLSGSWMCVGVCVYDMSLTHKAYTNFPRSRELRVRSGLRRARRDRQRGEGRGASRAVRFAYLLSVSPFLSFFPVADGLRSAHISRSSCKN